MQKLRVFIDSSLEEFSEISFASLQQLSKLMGLQVERVDAAFAHVAYGIRSDKALTIACAQKIGWKAIGNSTPIQFAGMIVPSASLCRSGSEVDPVLATHFFLSGCHESSQGSCDENGIPTSAVGVWGIIAEPIIQRLARRLKNNVLNTFPELDPRPLWPAGKKWALCLTHDCDYPIRYRPMGCVRDSLLALREQKLGAAAKGVAKSVYSALMSRVALDPYLASWKKWIEFERTLGIRSAFYVGTWNRYQPQTDTRDLNYSSFEPRIRRLVSQLHEEGWEVGLHSAIQAWRFPNRFAEEVSIFEESFGFRPTGFRAHYWSLNPKCREETLLNARAQVGFAYDTSMGMDEVHGMRRGIAYPYEPYLPNGNGVGLWELPPIMMDYSLYSAAMTNELRLSAFRERAESLRRIGGLFVLDWHEYTLARNVMDNLANDLLPEICRLKEDRECWIATPSAIINWCSAERWK